MSLKKVLIWGLALVLVMASASAALASSISIEPWLTYISTDGLLSNYCYAEWNEQDGSFYSYQPTAPGPFSLTSSGGSGSTYTYLTTYPSPLLEPGGSLSAGVVFDEDIFLTLTQAGPLRFSAISMTATVLMNGTEIASFQGAADANLIETGGLLDIWHDFTIGGEVPLTWQEAWNPSIGTYYVGEGQRNDSFSIGLTVTGTVIDPSDPAPLPSTLLLLGSGLGTLGIYSRRKFCFRS
jgi:hypothetical protein